MTGAVFSRVLVANRGEIAVRIMRTLGRLGIESVAVYTDVDRDALHVRLADRAVPIGAAGGYLDPARLVGAAVDSGAVALHPGYGFLSESPALARACRDAGVVFVGPPVESIELMGDKIRAKQTVSTAGVPTVPGSTDAGLSDEEIVEAALDIGLPVLLKPSAGGGGKGMRLVADAADLEAAVAAARREARAAFGDDTLMVERYITKPRHIEIQVFADAHGHTVALGERECSLQRRHQKIIEEAPSPLLDATTREAMGASAVAAARSCGYQNAGTVEFIVPGDRAGEFFFMEMNTRLQVEHPVTEMVLGVDLVEWQLRVAAGEELPWTEPPPVHGHAVEARVYAEDPDRGFLPASGTVVRLALPSTGDRVRVDSALTPGLTVGTSYDPMIAKVVAWGEDRPAALAELDRALAQTGVLGLTTNIGFLRRLIGDRRVQAGDVDTTLVEDLAAALPAPSVPAEVVAAAALLDQLLEGPAGPIVDPWSIRDGWRIGAPAPIGSTWRVGAEEIEAGVDPDGSGVVVGDVLLTLSAHIDEDRSLIVEDSSGRRAYGWARDGDDLWLGRQGEAWHLVAVRESIEHAGPAAVGTGQVTSPMPGTVLAVYVTPGQDVDEGDPLLSVEAMKMEHVLKAAVAGTVRDVLVKPGDRVQVDQSVAFVEEAGR